MGGRRIGVCLRWVFGGVCAVVCVVLLLLAVGCFFHGNAEGELQNAEDGAVEDGEENQQGEGIEEPDVLKTDGRYLYQLCITTDMDKPMYRFLQIADTKDGLEIVATLQWEEDEFVRDFYVWKDALVLIAQGKATNVHPSAAEWEKSCYRIHVYDIKDRANPRKIRSFAMKGEYTDSRISNGYLYVFGQCKAIRTHSREEGNKLYVPEMDGEPMEPERDFLPGDAVPVSYFVMSSMDMDHLDQFTDTKAIAVSGGEGFVSYCLDSESIYVIDSEEDIDERREANEGSVLSPWEQYSNSTKIYRFSHWEGKIEKAAEGKVRGSLNCYEGNFSVGAYNGYLRIVTEVKSKMIEKGESPKGTSVRNESSYNLYVLDEMLRVVGQLQDITENKYFEGMKFFGDLGVMVGSGYLEALHFFDLSRPWNPKPFGESKVNGFAGYQEYLQPYQKGLLLGIGAEGLSEMDPEERLKVSLLDVSDLADVKEKSRFLLDAAYGYSEAFYDHRSVLSDAKNNLYGFSLEALDKVSYQLFSIEGGELKEGFCLLCEDEIYDGNPTILDEGIRGTYIGGRFFLSYYSGRIAEYSLEDGQKVEEAIPAWQRLGIEAVFERNQNQN